jgi:hypothetical protein
MPETAIAAFWTTVVLAGATRCGVTAFEVATKTL